MDILVFAFRGNGFRCSCESGCDSWKCYWNGPIIFALHFKWLNLNQVEEVGTWLTDNMAIFFVPAGVGLMTNFDVLAEVWLQLLIIMIVTTAIMMWFIGSVVQKVKQSSDQKKDNTVVERTDTHV